MSADARAQILRRIAASLGTALGTSGPGQDRAVAAVPRNYRHAGDLPAGQVLDLLRERLGDYGVVVSTCQEPGMGAVIAARLAARSARTVVVPPGLDLALPVTCQVVVDEGQLTWPELDAIGAVLTGCAVVIAETGTIVLDGSPGQGRRAMSLLPDYHLCLVRAEQVVQTVPEALRRLDPGRPLTFISGPSATSDIELERVPGVHGPRTLDVILVAQ